MGLSNELGIRVIEMGWSGFMLPKLQRRFNPLLAALLVGLFWGGIWHLYADYIGAFGNRGWWGIPLVVLQPRLRHVPSRF